MGTRADFYIGRGVHAEWLGSIGWDGYPAGIGQAILRSESPDAFREAVAKFLASREDSTVPEQGWPWPWATSATTDYAYAFDAGVVASCFGSRWFDPNQPQPEDIEDNAAVFPDMSTAKQRDKFGPHSGIVLVRVPGRTP